MVHEKSLGLCEAREPNYFLALLRKIFLGIVLQLRVEGWVDLSWIKSWEYAMEGEGS